MDRTVSDLVGDVDEHRGPHRVVLPLTRRSTDMMSWSSLPGDDDDDSSTQQQQPLGHHRGTLGGAAGSRGGSGRGRGGGRPGTGAAERYDGRIRNLLDMFDPGTDSLTRTSGYSNIAEACNQYCRGAQHQQTGRGGLPDTVSLKSLGSISDSGGESDLPPPMTARRAAPNRISPASGSSPSPSSGAGTVRAARWQDLPARDQTDDAQLAVPRDDGPGNGRRNRLAAAVVAFKTKQQPSAAPNGRTPLNRSRLSMSVPEMSSESAASSEFAAAAPMSPMGGSDSVVVCGQSASAHRQLRLQRQQQQKQQQLLHHHLGARPKVPQRESATDGGAGSARDSPRSTSAATGAWATELEASPAATEILRRIRRPGRPTKSTPTDVSSTTVSSFDRGGSDDGAPPGTSNIPRPIRSATDGAVAAPVGPLQCRRVEFEEQQEFRRQRQQQQRQLGTLPKAGPALSAPSIDASAVTTARPEPPQARSTGPRQYIAQQQQQRRRQQIEQQQRYLPQQTASAVEAVSSAADPNVRRRLLPPPGMLRFQQQQHGDGPPVVNDDYDDDYDDDDDDDDDFTEDIRASEDKRCAVRRLGPQTTRLPRPTMTDVPASLTRTMDGRTETSSAAARFNDTSTARITSCGGGGLADLMPAAGFGRPHQPQQPGGSGDSQDRLLGSSSSNSSSCGGTAGSPPFRGVRPPYHHHQQQQPRHYTGGGGAIRRPPASSLRSLMTPRRILLLVFRALRSVALPCVRHFGELVVWVLGRSYEWCQTVLVVQLRAAYAQAMDDPAVRDLVDTVSTWLYYIGEDWVLSVIVILGLCCLCVLVCNVFYIPLS